MQLEIIIITTIEADTKRMKMTGLTLIQITGVNNQEAMMEGTTTDQEISRIEPLKMHLKDGINGAKMTIK